jgi:Chaperone of endosialidase
MIRIGQQGTQTGTFVAGIFGSTVASGVGVIVNSSGQLGTVLSSERFKEATKPMDKASEAILSLQPVTFRYKQELDPNGVPQFGLIAEQVDKINPDLVVRGEDGKVTTVRYEAVNAMLLNEFLKEHRKVEEQHWIEGNLFSGKRTSANVPLVVNLRADPFERAPFESDMYLRWHADKLWTLVPAQIIAGKFIGSFKDYPPSQRVGSMNLDVIMEQLQSGASGAGK